MNYCCITLHHPLLSPLSHQYQYHYHYIACLCLFFGLLTEVAAVQWCSSVSNNSDSAGVHHRQRRHFLL
uniref:Uncharacterized protein n=1 Tax=Octopus bimaculoides TaxID=37653 RepID=A0A0L8G855_OCTBM